MDSSSSNSSSEHNDDSILQEDLEHTSLVLVRKLGAGAYGQVFKCYDMKYQREVAIKVPMGSYEEDHAIEERFLQRIAEGEGVGKAYIIRLLDTLTIQNSPALVMEFFEDSLQEFLYQSINHRLDIHMVRGLGIQLIKAISYLKSLRIVHADIKPANIMVAGVEDGILKVKLIDFGGFEGSEEGIQVREEMTTLEYRSPEVLIGRPASYPVDMWAVAVTLVEAFAGTDLFPALSNWDLMHFFWNFFPARKAFFKGKYTKRYILGAVQECRSWLRPHHPPCYPCPVTTSICDLDQVVKDEPWGVQFDAEAFFYFISCCLTADPDDRMLPENALGEDFFSLNHLPENVDAEYMQKALRVVRAL